MCGRFLLCIPFLLEVSRFPSSVVQCTMSPAAHQGHPWSYLQVLLNWPLRLHLAPILWPRLFYVGGTLGYLVLRQCLVYIEYQDMKSLAYPSCCITIILISPVMTGVCLGKLKQLEQPKYPNKLKIANTAKKA